MKIKTISAMAAVLALGFFGTAALAADDGLPGRPELQRQYNSRPGCDDAVRSGCR